METTEATYDVLIVGFDQRDELPVERLERAFGIAPEAAAQIVGKLPAAVQRSVPRVRADYFSRALVMIGASVEVRDRQGELIAAHGPEPAARAGEPLVHVVRASDPAPAHGAPPPFVFQAAAAPQAPNAAIDPMSRTIAAAPPVMIAHEPPRAAQLTPAQPFAAAALAAALEPPAAHPTVREMNAVLPEAAHGAAAHDAGRPLHAAPTFITAPRGAAGQPIASQPPVAGPTLLTGAPRPVAEHAQHGAAAAAQLRATSDRAPREAAPAAAVASGWGDPEPLDQPEPHAGAAWVRVPSSVWDPPAPDGAQVAAPREPSSVFDPPPGKPPRAERYVPAANMLAPTLDPNARPGAASALEPAPVLAGGQHPIEDAIQVGAKPHPLDLPGKFGGGVPVLDLGPAKPAGAPAGLPTALEVAAASLASFDIGKSVAVNALWRPPAASPLPALTLDDNPAAVAHVLAPWEQANAQSTAEPPLELPPSPRLPPRIGPAAVQPDAAAQPPKAARPQAARAAAAGAAAQPVSRRAPPARPRGPKPPPGAHAGELPAAEGAIQRPAAPRAAAVGRPERGPSQRSLAGADLRSFWETVPEALVLPFSGPGLYWIFAISVWSIAVGVLLQFMSYAPFISLPFTIMLSNSTLAFACDYYRVCTWAPMTGDKVIDRKPDFDPVRLFHGYMRSGLHLLIFMIVSQIPGIWYFFHNLDGDDGAFGVLLDPITWLLFLLPYFYWPMGVGLTAIGNNFGAIWNVPQGARAIMRLPLEYGVIVFIGVLSFGFSLLCLLLFGQFLGITGILVSSTFGLPLAVSHGVQGALMGHLVRSNAEAFE